MIGVGQSIGTSLALSIGLPFFPSHLRSRFTCSLGALLLMYKTFLGMFFEFSNPRVNSSPAKRNSMVSSPRLRFSFLLYMAWYSWVVFATAPLGLLQPFLRLDCWSNSGIIQTSGFSGPPWPMRQWQAYSPFGPRRLSTIVAFESRTARHA